MISFLSLNAGGGVFESLLIVRCFDIGHTRLEGRV